MRHSLDDDRPVSPFGLPPRAGVDRLAGALTDQVWDAFYTADRVLWLARAKGVKFELPKEVEGPSLVRLVKMILFTDPYAIYSAASGLSSIYETVVRQGHNLFNRYSDVDLDWEGRAADTFGTFNNNVINYFYKDNHDSVAQFLQDSITFLMSAADSVVDMRTNLAEQVCTVAESALGTLKDALSQLEDDERNLVQEIVEGISTEGIATGVQAATEIAQLLVGVLSTAIEVVKTVISQAGIETKQFGNAAANQYLTQPYKFGSTAAAGDAPADYSDYQEWKLTS